jgi:hypothetical protein
MNKLTMVIPLVFLLCFVSGCQKGKDVAQHPLEQTKIAFQSNRDGKFDIYIMNADGSEQTNLTDHPAADDQYPSWSPFLEDD